MLHGNAMGWVDWQCLCTVCALRACAVNPTRTETHPQPPTTSVQHGKQQKGHVKYSATLAQLIEAMHIFK